MPSATTPNPVSRPRWFQLSLRTLLLLVTLSGIGTAVSLRYSRLYKSLTFHRQQLQQLEKAWDSGLHDSFLTPPWAWNDNEERSAFHRQQIVDGERALWRPWLSIPPLDTPAPASVRLYQKELVDLTP